MTKKAEKEARVEANKRAAYVKKVTTLLGHVLSGRASIVEQIHTAYSIGEDALEVAAIIASREPVGKVIHPIKVHAVEVAETHARAAIEAIRAKLEAAGWDINKVAPYPSSFGKNALYGNDYKVASARYSRFASVTRSIETTRRHGDPVKIVKMNDDLVERFVQGWKDDAAIQYDMFICKLVGKIGACDSATIDGSHVWGFSILTVTKGAVVENWKTQQIENVSVLGKYFPQWPTRLMKGGA